MNLREQDLMGYNKEPEMVKEGVGSGRVAHQNHSYRRFLAGLWLRRPPLTHSLDSWPGVLGKRATYEMVNVILFEEMTGYVVRVCVCACVRLLCHLCAPSH